MSGVEQKLLSTYVNNLFTDVVDNILFKMDTCFSFRRASRRSVMQMECQLTRMTFYSSPRGAAET